LQVLQVCINSMISLNIFFEAVDGAVVLLVVEVAPEVEEFDCSNVIASCMLTLPSPLVSV